MLISNEEDDIYIAAHKREELRLRDLEREKKRARKNSDDSD